MDDRLEVALVDDQHPVQAFPMAASNPALRMSICPGRHQWSQNDSGGLRLEDPIGLGRKLRRCFLAWAACLIPMQKRAVRARAANSGSLRPPEPRPRASRSSPTRSCHLIAALRQPVEAELFARHQPCVSASNTVATVFRRQSPEFFTALRDLSVAAVAAQRGV